MLAVAIDALASGWGALGERDREAELSRIGGSLYRLSMAGSPPIKRSRAIARDSLAMSLPQ